MTATTLEPAPDLTALFGRHVRLRPADSAAKSTTRHSVGDEFGFLIDIGSTAYLGLRNRIEDTDGELRVYLAGAYRIAPYPFRRVHVFFYPYRDENFWTWCRETGGSIFDSYSGLSQFGSWGEAWAPAQEWLAKALARDNELSKERS